jgi:hypothetical protein
LHRVLGRDPYRLGLELEGKKPLGGVIDLAEHGRPQEGFLVFVNRTTSEYVHAAEAAHLAYAHLRKLLGEPVHLGVSEALDRLAQYKLALETRDVAQQRGLVHRFREEEAEYFYPKREQTFGTAVMQHFREGGAIAHAAISGGLDTPERIGLLMLLLGRKRFAGRTATEQVDYVRRLAERERRYEAKGKSYLAEYVKKLTRQGIIRHVS